MRAARGSPARLAWAGMVLGALFLTGCASAPKPAPSPSPSEEARASLESQMAAIQAEIERLKDDNQAEKTRSEELETRNQNQVRRIQELEATNAKLAALLDEVDSFGLGGQNPAPAPSPESGGAAAGEGTGEAHPSSAAEAPQQLVAAALDPVPSQVSAEPAVEYLDSAAVLAEAAALVANAKRQSRQGPDPGPGLGLGKAVFYRTERQNQRGTELFVERDSLSGEYYLYHRQAWYDQAGVFVEFVRPADGKFQARLVLQVPDPLAEAPLDDIKINGESIGKPLSTKALREGSDSFSQAVYLLDDRLAEQLRRNLAEAYLSVLVLHGSQGDSPAFSASPAQRQALRSMLDARLDLR